MGEINNRNADYFVIKKCCNFKKKSKQDKEIATIGNFESFAVLTRKSGKPAFIEDFVVKYRIIFSYGLLLFSKLCDKILL